MSQQTFQKIIVKGLRRNFATTVETSEDLIKFLIVTDSFSADVAVSGFEPEPDQYGVKVAFWLCDSEGDYLNFSNTSYNELLLFCNKLAQFVEWCTLSPVALDEDYLFMSIYTTLDTDIEDAEVMATASPNDSRLLRGLLRITREAEMLYPVLYGISTGQISDIDNFKHFLPDEDEVSH